MRFRFATPRAGLAALLLASVCPATAQQALGTVASGCGAFDAGGTFALALAAPLPSGASPLVSVVALGVRATDLSVADGTPRGFRAAGAQRVRRDDAVVAQWIGGAGSALASGATVTFRAGGMAAGRAVCATVSAFGDLASLTGPRASGHARADAASSAARVALSGVAVGQAGLTHAVVLYRGDPGALTGLDGLVVGSPICAPGICLATGYRIDAPVGAQAIAIDSSGVASWNAVATRVLRESLFADGFESP